MEWRGDEARLQQLCQMFEAGSSANTQVQQQVMQSLSQFSQLPDFNMYLLAVFAQMPSQSEVVRQFAGLLLKTHLTRVQPGGLPQAEVEHILGHVLAAMQDGSRTIRHTAGTILTTMVAKCGFAACGPALEKLVASIVSGAQEVVEGSLSALSKICEDGVSSSGYENEQLFVAWSSQSVLPRVFECATPTSPVFARQIALECLNHFALHGAWLEDMHPAFKPYCSRYIEVLGVLANDTVPAVIQAVCKGFSCAVEQSWPCLTDQHYEVILTFMLKASQHSEYDVRLDALSVWAHCAGPCQSWAVVQSLLPQLVPVLLVNMVYSNADYMCMERTQLEDDNAASPDQLDDIDPRFHKIKAVEGEEDDDDGGTAGGAWGWERTVRKTAASSLDALAISYQAEILGIVLPHIQQKLEDSSWEQQEAGVLAIGAISKGCMDHLVQYLPKVMELLLTLCAAPQPLLRSIACWSVSRFGPWVCHEQNPQREQILGQVVRTLLQRCLDRNKRVQEAACSAVATLEEIALVQLTPHLTDMVQTFVSAFQLYQLKNMRILYDAIGTLAWASGKGLDRPEYVHALMVPMMRNFETIPDNDITTLALFECLSSMVQHLGPSLVTLVPSIVARCVRIIQEGLRAALMWEQNPNEFEKPNRELVAASVDLLAGIVEGFGEQTPQLLTNHNFLLVIPGVLKDKEQRVKQSGFALVGTCASKCISSFTQLLPDLLPLCTTALGETSASVRNNASWAIGEISVRVGPDFLGPHVDNLVQALGGALTRPAKPWEHAEFSLKQNLGITLGRLGLMCGDRMGKHLPSFLRAWCVALRSARNDPEKVKAFHGLCNAIRANAEAGLPCFPELASALVSFSPPWGAPPPELQQVFREILCSYQQAFGTQWPAVYCQIPQEVQRRLQQLYGLGV